MDRYECNDNDAKESERTHVDGQTMGRKCQKALCDQDRKGKKRKEENCRQMRRFPQPPSLLRRSHRQNVKIFTYPEIIRLQYKVFRTHNINIITGLSKRQYNGAFSEVSFAFHTQIHTKWEEEIP